MNDTTPEIVERMHEMIQEKSALERLEMGCSMHATSKKLIIRSILEDNPGISQKALR